MFISQRKCPICNSNKNLFIKNIKFSLFEGHPMQGGYDLIQCKICSFIYADTKVTQTELDEYYSNLSKYENKEISTGGGYSDYDRNRLIDTAEYISKVFDDKKIEIADVGCASGGLLEQLRKEGFNNITGIDPSISCVNITKYEKGINCFNSSLFNLDKTFGKYDLLILSHVWEHILDLEAALNSIKKILKPDGYIYVECPNAMNYKNLIHSPYQEFNTEHINHFSFSSLNNFFAKRGFDIKENGTKIMKIASGGDYDAVYGLYRKVREKSNYEIKFDIEILPSIKEYIKLSDKMYLKLINQIKSITALNQNIALIGIGQLAFKILYTIKELKIKNKIFLFDSNILYEGKKIINTKIFSSRNIVSNYKNEKFNVIITSMIYQNEISKYIENEFKKNNLEIPHIFKLGK